ncbi:uncharacterized protein JN550_013288 [Neoarthrinium moseri]|uniref:uncharacterized protein n=1 Tax=Neoarthrinium moseri TaxID=1658444 RepID=UPI001FDE22B5|nr:uncharacterized protein JN550_013288 [Neoarthrinium moseri]KAI1857308.1 hypothetical protein JN550_013288 [Neoarthrinium moseri]
MAPAACTVRHAHVPTIIELVRELADYEHELDAVEATDSKLLATIAFAPDGVESTSTARNTEPTSPERPARCLLLFNESGAPCGMALYFYNYSTWRAKPGIYLEDLFVRPSERKKGYGKKLLVELAKEVVSMDGGRLEWGDGHERVGGDARRPRRPDEAGQAARLEYTIPYQIRPGQTRPEEL